MAACQDTRQASWDPLLSNKRSMVHIGRQGRVGPGVRREQLLCVTSFHSCNDTIKSVTMPTSEMRAQRLRNELRFHSWI